MNVGCGIWDFPPSADRTGDSGAAEDIRRDTSGGNVDDTLTNIQDKLGNVTNNNLKKKKVTNASM